MPFARRESGIEVSGNAWQWWENAAGLYLRGAVPQPGAVLVFEANRRMPLGHVAVVTRILDSRDIEVDQANWPHGNIERGITVIDVSARNDWTAVRVEIGHGGDYGSIYPTYGFIYGRRDRWTPVVVAARTSVRELNPAPTDLREVPADEELAEAPDPSLYRHRRHVRLARR